MNFKTHENQYKYSNCHFVVIYAHILFCEELNFVIFLFYAIKPVYYRMKILHIFRINYKNNLILSTISVLILFYMYTKDHEYNFINVYI